MKTNLCLVALDRVSLEDLLWSYTHGLISASIVKEYFILKGKEYVPSSEHWNLASLPVDDVRFSDTLGIISKNYGAGSVGDPFGIFSAIFLCDIHKKNTDVTGKLYEILALIGDLGAPDNLDWMVFLGPNNPFKDLPDGDDQLYQKIYETVVNTLK